MTDQPAPLTPPANATEAQARLTSLVENRDWGAKIVAGDVTANREMRALTAMIAGGGDDVAAAIVSGNKLPELATSEQRLMAATAEHLREMGFPPTAIRETISGKEPTPADVERARLWKTQIMKNPEWVRRYLDGDGDAQREMMAANILLSSAKEAAA
jgi:hypothetical protein